MPRPLVNFNFSDRLKNHLFKFVRGDRLFSNDLLLEGDRLNNHFLKFVRGDRYSTH
jgi:FMN-dependent NADH-azoreductase